MKTEIFIVSYSPDIQYLEYCIRSVEKFARGFSGVTLLVPTHERKMGLWANFEYRNGIKIKLRDYTVPDNRALWHLAHQIQKCRAEEWCPDADLILHTDSDCIFTEAVTPDDYIIDGKPRLMIEDFTRMPGSHWKDTTERALGTTAKYETMRQHPAVHYAGMYGDMRRRVEAVHNMPFNDYVLAQKPDFPWGFSEFCALGAFVLIASKWKSKYHIIDLGRSPWPKTKLMQFWSHGPIDSEQPMPNGGKGTPMAVFKMLGL